jgi:hypothetical protein
MLSWRGSRLAAVLEFAYGRLPEANGNGASEVNWQPADRRVPIGHWVVLLGAIVAVMAMLGWRLSRPGPHTFGVPEPSAEHRSISIERVQPLRILNPSAPTTTLPRRERRSFSYASPPPRAQPPPRRGAAEYATRRRSR